MGKSVQQESAPSQPQERKLSKKDIQFMFDQGYMTKEKYDELMASGLVKTGTGGGKRSSEAISLVGAEEQLEAVREAAVTAAKAKAEELGIISTSEAAGAVQFQVYFKGAGKPRAEKKVPQTPVNNGEAEQGQE